MDEKLPEVKTPVLKDKRFAVGVATLLGLFLSAFLKIDVPVETLAAIVASLLGLIGASAAKEAAVAKANAAAIGEKHAAEGAKSAADALTEAIEKAKSL